MTAVKDGILYLKQKQIPGKGHTPPQKISIGTKEWYDFLCNENTTSFSYFVGDGWATARKENRPRGTGYWSMYKKVNGKLRKAYIGKSADITLAKLEEARTKLNVV